MILSSFIIVLVYVNDSAPIRKVDPPAPALTLKLLLPLEKCSTLRGSSLNSKPGSSRSR